MRLKKFETVLQKQSFEATRNSTLNNKQPKKIFKGIQKKQG